MFDCSNYFRSRLYASSGLTSVEVESGYYPPQMTSYDVDIVDNIHLKWSDVIGQIHMSDSCDKKIMHLRIIMFNEIFPLVLTRWFRVGLLLQNQISSTHDRTIRHPRIIDGPCTIYEDYRNQKYIIIILFLTL